jgi:transcriptional regulator with XRE-family HTH domain
MAATNATSSLEKDRRAIAAKLRELRQARGWTQAELASHLGLSQARLSEVERGAGSFTAEQFLAVLRLFNVAVADFVPPPRGEQRERALQNTLARLGARHLHESSSTLASATLGDIADVVREALLSGNPRLITALAPAIVGNIDDINLPRVRARQSDAALSSRFAWLIENILDAIRHEAEPLPPGSAKRLRRAEVVLRSLLESITSEQHAGPHPVTDVLDADIRSQKTLSSVAAASSAISRKWNIISRLLPDDFLTALRSARDAA